MAGTTPKKTDSQTYLRGTMIDLDARYHEYLIRDNKNFRLDGIDEKVKAYGYTDNGKEIDGYYVTTENYTFYFCKEGVFQRKEELVK